MDESQKYKVEKKEAMTEEYTLYVSIYIKFMASKPKKSNIDLMGYIFR